MVYDRTPRAGRKKKSLRRAPDNNEPQAANGSVKKWRGILVRYAGYAGVKV
jgi:hypothetical protein